MRNVLIIPSVVAFCAFGAWGLFRALHWPEHLHEIVAAALVCACSGEVSLIPALRVQKFGAAATSQGALVGTLIHMFLTLVLAAVIWAQHVVAMQRPTFIYLLLVFYWTSLIGLVISLARIIRSAAASALGHPVS